MGNNALFVLYRVTSLRCDKHSDLVFETRLDIPKTKIASTGTFLITVVVALALSQIPLTYPMIALASNKT